MALNGNETKGRRGREKGFDEAGGPQAVCQLVKNLQEVHRWQGILLGELAQRSEKLMDQKKQ